MVPWLFFWNWYKKQIQQNRDCRETADKKKQQKLPTDNVGFCCFFSAETQAGAGLKEYRKLTESFRGDYNGDRNGRICGFYYRIKEMGMNMKHTKLRQGVRKALAVAAASVMASLMWTQAAYATSTISTVNITLDIDLEAGEPLPNLATGYSGDDCEVYVSNNSRYDLRSARWVKDPDEAALGTSYSLRIYVEALDDYRFNGTYSSRNVNIKGGDLVSVKRESSRELVVTAKTRPAEGQFDPPEDPHWLDPGSKSNFGQARWDKVDNASYDLYLYRGDKLVQKMTDVTGTSYNFYPYMTVKGTYAFKIRAVAKDDETAKYAKSSDWVYSDEVYIGEEDVSDGTGQTTGSQVPPENAEQVGWLQNNGYWYYRYPDGSYLNNCWAKIGGFWYLFDSNGVMMTGWHSRGGHYYYMASSGEMRTGWLQDGDHWYYLNPDAQQGVEGAMATGWVHVNGVDYYMGSDGAMLEGWQEVEGSWYYFYPGSGAKASSTYIDGFYVDQNGIWHKPQLAGC